MGETLVDAVRDGALVEQRCVAPQTGLQQRLFADNVQVSLLRAGKTRFRQVFRRRAASDCDRQDLTRVCAELLVSRMDLQLQILGKLRGDDRAANLCAPRMQLVDV